MNACLFMLKATWLIYVNSSNPISVVYRYAPCWNMYHTSTMWAILVISWFANTLILLYSLSYSYHKP